MFKKNISIIIGVLLIIAIGTCLLLFKKTASKKDDEFLKSLKGEIVFNRRDGLYMNIYKINANGTDEKMLYHHENKINSNASHPIWSEDGSKIYFTALIGDDWKNSEWKIFEMNTDGKNIKISKDKVSLPIVSKTSREKEIVVDFGNIYYLDAKGEKNLVYRHKNYDYYENPGPEECSWSPDKKYIICDLDGYVMVINKEGAKMVKVAKGFYPDWKY